MQNTIRNNPQYSLRLAEFMTVPHPDQSDPLQPVQLRFLDLFTHVHCVQINDCYLDLCVSPLARRVVEEHVKKDITQVGAFSVVPRERGQ